MWSLVKNSKLERHTCKGKNPKLVNQHTDYSYILITRITRYIFKIPLALWHFGKTVFLNTFWKYSTVIHTGEKRKEQRRERLSIKVVQLIEKLFLLHSSQDLFPLTPTLFKLWLVTAEVILRMLFWQLFLTELCLLTNIK